MMSDHQTAREDVELSLVMPAYNEGPGIAAVIEGAATVLTRLGRTFEIIMVDDGSTDETAAVLEALAGSLPQFRLLRLRSNAGQHIATVVGLRAARGAMVIVSDADEQVPLGNVEALVAAALDNPRADVVAGIRDRRNTDRHRDLGSRLVTMLINHLTQGRLKDPATTLRLFRRRAVREILQADILAQNLPILVGFLRLKVVEVPVTVNPARARGSHYDVMKLVHVLILALLNFSAGTTTILTLMALGCLSGLAGLAGLGSVVAWGVVEQAKLPTNWLLFFILLLIIGLQFVLVGAVAYKVERINVNLRFRRQLESMNDGSPD